MPIVAQLRPIDLNNFSGQTTETTVVSFSVPVNYPFLNDLVSMPLIHTRTYSISLTPPINECVSYLSAMILFFLDLKGLFFSSPKSLWSQWIPFNARSIGICPRTAVSPTWSVQLRFFHPPLRNRTCAQGNEPNPVEIKASSAIKGKSGLATGLTPLVALHLFICAWYSSPFTKTCVKRGSNQSQGPSTSTALLRK